MDWNIVNVLFVIAEMKNISMFYHHMVTIGVTLVLRASTNVTDAISYATCTTAIDLHAKAILSSTSSGHTARMVSKFRPSCPIVATTSNERVMRQLSLTWGVLPTLSNDGTNTDEVIANSMNAAKENNFVAENDLVVITAGVPVATSGTTNLVKVETI